jgi:putative ABC transport system ATP-binding protein
LTAYENIALALTILKRPAEEIDQKVRSVAKLLGIEAVLDKFPYQMSGGQKQRVASARAIITKPALILADEPTGALDSKSAKTLLQNFERLVKDHRATILMVTHDAVAASYCDRIIFIRDGQVFHQLSRGKASRKAFFDNIIKVISYLGDSSDVES